jgi:hypothetical protein
MAELVDYSTVKLDKVTLRQTAGFPRPGEPPPPAPPQVELSEAQKARLQRQQLFKESFAKLEDLRLEILHFSLSHHYFKESTKKAWVRSLDEALDGMRAFLPRERSQEETPAEN